MRAVKRLISRHVKHMPDRADLVMIIESRGALGRWNNCRGGRLSCIRVCSMCSREPLLSSNRLVVSIRQTHSQTSELTFLRSLMLSICSAMHSLLDGHNLPILLLSSANSTTSSSSDRSTGQRDPGGYECAPSEILYVDAGVQVRRMQGRCSREVASQAGRITSRT